MFARGNIFITSFDQEAICQQQTARPEKVLTLQPADTRARSWFLWRCWSRLVESDSPLHRRVEDSNVQVTTQRMKPLAVWLHAISRPASGGSWQPACAGTAKQGLTSVRCGLRTRAFARAFFQMGKVLIFHIMPVKIAKKLQAICGINTAGSVTEAHLQSPRRVPSARETLKISLKGKSIHADSVPAFPKMLQHFC